MSHPQKILQSLEANARKSLSQNFLTSPHWADLLSSETLKPRSNEPYDEIWEIGPGLGALTSKLLEKATVPVRAFEYDRKLSQYLRETYPTLNLLEGDVMDADFATLAAGKRLTVLSNTPYHLSSAILFKLLEIKPQLVQIVLTFQREFAERLTAKTRTGNYGALTVIAQLHFDLESLGVLPPGAFYPAPAVASEAVRFVPRTPETQSPEKFAKVVKAAFEQRRKQISGNLRKAFPEAPVVELLGELGILPTARAEELSKDQFVALTERLKPWLDAVCPT